ncbi:hypothetical protein SYNPS1DRAFT_29281 [Syncephalis pseudoplumigaleata]|uniref:Uncharacterized protein n=2 Tax=Syncephalis pseudoplumigaleata TaxID=1712513 RepID=A0A4P9YXW1_9FUNG|nr:hypothetical protein SYNPS1DRAFT_29281 [Syncephalis pseudoplumigaleata]|eukprot:RKP24973.1 hypothetical protein SYNPS1DRAFT_29281 [Syncephalis pseudoplumigaleata]
MDFARLQKVSVLKKEYELVTEAEMRAAKDQVADQVEPQMINLLSQVEDILCALEVERDHIAAKLDEPLADEQGTPAKRTPTAKPGAQKLKAVKRKKEMLVRDAKRLRMELQNKSDEQSTEDEGAVEAKQPSEDHYKQLKAEHELLAKTLSDRRALLEASRAMAAAQAASKQQETAKQTENVVLPSAEAMELGIALDAELREVKSDGNKAAKEKRALAIKQCKALVKLFFSQRSVGNTMSRLLELLLETNDRQLTMRALEEVRLVACACTVALHAHHRCSADGMQEFPPAKEARHGLKQAIVRLRELGLVTTRTVIEPQANAAAGDVLICIEFTEEDATAAA